MVGSTPQGGPSPGSGEKAARESAAGRQPGRKADLKASTQEALLWLVLGAGILGLAALFALSVEWPRVIRGQTDFLQFYTGAVLAGTDGMYSMAANREAHLRLAGFTTKQGTYFIRPPFYAAVLHPLAFLPYQSAYWVFQAVSIAAAVILVRLYRGPWQATAAMLLFFPLVVSILLGQDITLIMAICAAAILLHRSGRDAAAGFVLSLCSIKFHLFVLIPLVLIRHGKWRMIGGAAMGAVAWLAISTIVAGPAWPMRYLAVLENPVMNPDLDRMPTIQGILLGSPLAVPAAVVVLGLFLFAIARLRNFEDSFGLALAGGLLLSMHSYIYDCVILLPALVAAIRGNSAAARGIALFLMTPITYFLLLLGHGVTFLLCLVALAVLRTLNSAKSLGEPCITV